MRGLSASWLFLVALLILSASQLCSAKSWASVAAGDPPASSAKAKPAPKPRTRSSSGAASAKKEPAPPPVLVSKKLPAGAVKAMVRNVYDGDTLTLIDEKRVRFLGIDTPEVAEKQPFAQEAKAYTRNYCHKKEIYLTFDPYGDKEDKFGRLLAFVWVEVEGGYLCINEGIVQEGLATVYLPNKEARLSNLKKMLALQNQARKAGRGIWGSFTEMDVLVTRNGAAYHKPKCKHLYRSRNLRTLKASAAIDKGLHPCRTCLS